MRRTLAAFTLLEVVVAIGVFAVGMVAVIGLFSPVVKSVGDSADAESATRVADLLNVKLQAQGIPVVGPNLKIFTGKTAHQLTTADASGSYNIATDSQLLFASRDGTMIGAFNDPVWVNGSRDKFFEIALIRNETISPVGSDTTAPLLAYTARVRWPAFIALAGGTGSVQVGANPIAVVPFDQSQKQVLFFTGAITR